MVKKSLCTALICSLLMLNTSCTTIHDKKKDANSSDINKNSSFVNSFPRDFYDALFYDPRGESLTRYIKHLPRDFYDALFYDNR